MHIRHIIPLALCLLAALRAGSAAAQSSHDGGSGGSPGDYSAPLFDNLGRYHFPVATKTLLAQRFFDQGLILCYAFNHAEAIRSFKEAARLDPDCAMAYWGIAFALGPNINAPMPTEVLAEANAALQKAQQAAGRAGEKERALIGALAKRYPKAAVEDRKPFDRAYADAMRAVAKKYPDDPDALTLFAEAVMDTMPWDYWTKDGKPKPGTVEAVAALETALARNPLHPGANHFYIHAVEASPHPEKALACAHRLGDIAPGAGHLVHMPSHIYIRVGQYHLASEANERAIKADDAYITACRAQGLYPLAYRPHNKHFLWAAATLEGRSEKALQAARDMAEHTDKKLMEQPETQMIQHFWISPLYALVRFGRWEEILKEPEPKEILLYPRAIRRYARGIALARTGKLPEAAQELELLAQIAARPEMKAFALGGTNNAADVLAVARETLAGELAAEQGDYAKALKHLETAVALQDALNYDEPPAWYTSTRLSLGTALLQAGRAADAEKVFEADLKQFPENGWGLFGLLQSLRKQGRNAEAAGVEKRFREAWRNADIALTAARF